jgi:membrane protein implicated in regulation of membrane protease activity
MYNEKMWSGRILLKYVLIQLPEIAVLVLLLVIVGQWIEIAAWLNWGLVGVWVAKDVILYPFVWRAYEWRSEKETSPMAGRYGIAKERLNPSGYVFVRGELWKARVIEGGVIEKGENVLVKGSRGLTLLVESAVENRITERS